MSKQPDQCKYCDGHGNSTAGGVCGFCDKGKPLDTQADWDASWGRIRKTAKSESAKSNISNLKG